MQRSKPSRKIEITKQQQEFHKRWQSLSLSDQLKYLDKSLGKGVGASKQRAKIALKMEESKLKKSEKVK